MTDEYLIIYNTCGLGGKSNVDKYIQYINTILNQKGDVNYHLVVSSCCNSYEDAKILIKEFSQRNVSFNFIYDKLPVNVTLNDTVNKCRKFFGKEFCGYMYVDSGTLFERPNDLETIFAVFESHNCGMLSTDSTSDSGIVAWGINVKPDDVVVEIPIGKAVHSHVCLVNKGIVNAYGRMWPDIFASFCTESIFSFICASVAQKYMLTPLIKLTHFHGMDFASAGFVHEHFAVIQRQNDGKGVWDHTFKTKKSMKEILSNPEAYASGMGYEEIQNVFPHNKECYYADGTSKDPERLRKFIADNFYLKKDEFDYSTINGIFLP